MSLRYKLRKMIFFFFIFQMEEQVQYFFPSQIRYGVFDVYNLKKIKKKDQILRLQMMNMSEVTLLLEQTLENYARLHDNILSIEILNSEFKQHCFRKVRSFGTKELSSIH